MKEERDQWAELRRRMVEEQVVRRGLDDPDVLAAMRAVPRHLFVPEHLAAAAYDDTPLPIGWEQTISQPYMVALMTHLAHVDARSRVLDVGAGSGYQSAVLAEIGAAVFAVERLAGLEEQARERLHRLGYAVQVVLADGSRGWPQHAPYDAIVVGAAALEAPQPLLDQLAPARPAGHPSGGGASRPGAHRPPAAGRRVSRRTERALPLRPAGGRPSWAPRPYARRRAQGRRTGAGGRACGAGWSRG